jgi:hypothetical protein
MQKPPTPPYCDKLAAINKEIRCWKIVKSHMALGRNVNNILEGLKQTIPKPMHHMLDKKTRCEHAHQKSSRQLQAGSSKCDQTLTGTNT